MHVLDTERACELGGAPAAEMRRGGFGPLDWTRENENEHADGVMFQKMSLAAKVVVRDFGGAYS